jgi:hypothetical protein
MVLFDVIESAPCSVAAMAGWVMVLSSSGRARWPPPLLPYRAAVEPTLHATATHVVRVLDVDAPRDLVIGTRNATSSIGRRRAMGQGVYIWKDRHGGNLIDE